MVKVALLARLVAKPGKARGRVAGVFLSSARCRSHRRRPPRSSGSRLLSKNEFGIFDAFLDDAEEGSPERADRRRTHGQAGELLAEPPKIEQVDLLAVKHTK